jgi:antitoxin (DNA-binding transcriptional repressor) of toxin-antitoxin stability system
MEFAIPMLNRISVTKAARQFSDLINRVRYQGVSFEIERGQEVVARIIPASLPVTLSIAELDEKWKQLPRLDPEDAVLFQETLDDIRLNAVLPDPIWE